LEWEIKELLNQYKRLRDHKGFPCGREDPVFLQSEIENLLSLDEDDYLDTLCVAIPMVDPNGNVSYVHFTVLHVLHQSVPADQ
jgi:hypothetical protein